MRVLVLSLLFSASCTCREQSLTGLADQLRVPLGVDCGRVRVGATVAIAAEVENVGRTTVEGVQWAVSADTFEVEGPLRIEPGGSRFVVRCTAREVGAFDGVVTVSSGEKSLSIGVSGEGVATPSCPAPGPCTVANWSDESGRCTVAHAADGAPCELNEACLVAATCQAGRCTGGARDCDDHDECTVDACGPTGCVHAPRECSGDGVCQVGVCDPRLGCGLSAVEDGLPCGPLRTCVAAQVCLSGHCEVRDPPDDFVCAEESPCQSAGRCVGSTCVQGPVATLRASWTAQVPQPDGGPPEAWSDMLTAPDGGVTVSSYFMSAPTIGLNSVPRALLQAARRCISWNGALACGDYPGTSAAAVSAIDPQTGVTRWTYTRVAFDLPSFAGPSVQVFLARLAEIDEHRLAGVFESRTPDANGVDTRCRRFGIVVLDELGRAISNAMIEHPIFDVCTHPHSYGVAVDVTGNLYLAFSPSDVDNPATAIDGTTIFSYSPSLSLRWTAVEPMLQGGELAVARGQLFHERARTVWSATTGTKVGQLPIPFGFGVVTRDIVLPAPAEGATEMVAIEAQTLAVRWRQPLNFVAGGPMHLGAMTTSFGRRTVALAFAGDASNRELTATDVATGARFFSCPIDLTLRPVQSALTAGQLAVMSGPRPVVATWPTCDHCDPRWARTRSTFLTFPIPGLYPVAAPWPGAWGGIGHDHHEDPLP